MIRPPPERSLRGALTRSIALASLAVIAAAALVSSATAFLEAREHQDELLAAVAALVRAGQLPDGGALGEGGTFHEDVDDESLVIRSLGTGATPVDTAGPDLTPGFHTRNIAGATWRLRVDERDGRRFLIAQRTEVRNDSAVTGTLHTFVPTALLVAVMLFVVHRVVRRRFARLDALTARLGAGDTRGPDALARTEVPSEIRPFIDAVEALRERDAATLKRQRRFIADAAHELRTPIAALSVQAENLDRAVDAEERRARLHRLGLGIVRLQRLVAQLLDLARLQEGADGTVSTVRAADVVRHVVAELMPLAEARGIDLGSIALADATFRDVGDDLSRLLTNALDNALRHAPLGGRVDVAVREEADRVVLDVEDTGAGLPAGDLERVFEPFRRGDDAHGPGTGLGLAICREIAARHGGSVTLSNRPEGGLRFRYAQPRVGAVPASQAAGTARVSGDDGHARRIRRAHE